MKKHKILFVERQPSGSPSLEKVFRGIAENLSGDFEYEFQQVPYGSRFSDTLRNLLFFRRRNADIYHITGHVHYISLLFDPRNTVLSIMDVGFLYSKRGLRYWLLKKLYLDWPLKRLKFITTISEHTRNEIVRVTQCESEEILVLDLPLLIEPPDRDNAPGLAEGRPRILQIGTTANKNIPNLARALKGIRCELRIIGSLDEQIIRVLEENGVEHSFDEGLTDEQMAGEYRQADIVSFCSLYEGFGLPIIEAQAAGKPVITSDLSPMTDTAGGAAVFVDPHDISSIKSGIERLIGDAGLRTDLVEAGQNNIKRFSPTRVAAGYEDLYRKMLENLNPHERTHASTRGQNLSVR